MKKKASILIALILFSIFYFYNKSNDLSSIKPFGEKIVFHEDLQNKGQQYISSVVKSQKEPKLEDYIPFLKAVFLNKKQFSAVALAIVYNNKSYRVVIGEEQALNYNWKEDDYSLIKQLKIKCKSSVTQNIKNTCEISGF